MLSASKLLYSVSTSGPSSISKPSELKKPTMSRITRVIGCSRAGGGRGAGQARVEPVFAERAVAGLRLERRPALGHGLLDPLLGLVGEPSLAQALGLGERAQAAQPRSDRALAAQIGARAPASAPADCSAAAISAQASREQRLEAVRLRRHGGGT